MNIRQIQQEVGVWQAKNFPNQPISHPLMGVAEEAGELLHHWLKKAQGIQGDNHDEEIIDAIGDLVIFLMGYCEYVGLDLETVVASTWSKVRMRDWRSDPVNGITRP